MPVDQSPTCVAPQYVLCYIQGKETARTNNERSFVAIVNYNNTYNPYSRTLYSGSTLSAGSCGSLGLVNTNNGSTSNVSGSAKYISSGTSGSIQNLSEAELAINEMTGNERALAEELLEGDISHEQAFNIFNITEKFMAGQIYQREAANQLKALGISPEVNDTPEMSVISFKLGNKEYSFTHHKIYGTQPDLTLYMKEQIDLPEIKLAKYFDLYYSDSDGNKFYALKPNCGYTSIIELAKDVCEEYKEDLILYNFLNDKNRETSNLNAFKKLDGNKDLTVSNYLQYVDEISAAASPDNNDNIINKVIQDFTNGNLTYNNARALLELLNVRKIRTQKQGDLNKLTFTYNNKSYTIYCNMDAARSSTDNITQQTYKKEDLFAVPGANEELINEYFEAAVTVGQDTTTYHLKETKKYDDFVNAAKEKTSSGASNCNINLWTDLWDTIDDELQKIEDEENNSSGTKPGTTVSSGAIQSDSTSSISTNTVQADSSLSISGSSNVDPFATISNMSDDEYRTSVIEHYTVYADEIPSNLSGKTAIIDSLSMKAFYTMVQETMSELQKQISKKCKDANFPVDVNLVETVIRITNDNIALWHFVNEWGHYKHLGNGHYGYLVSYEAFYQYYSELFSNELINFLTDQAVTKPSERTLYKIVADMTESQYTVKMSDSFNVEGDGIDSNYGVSTIMKGDNRSPLLALAGDLINKVINDVRQKINIQCYNNNIPYNSEVISQAIDNLKSNTRLLEEIKYSCTRTIYIRTEQEAKTYGVEPWGCYYTEIDNYHLVQQIRIALNEEIKNLLDVQKPTVTYIEFEYDPNLELTEEEQRTLIDIQNLLTSFVQLATNYPESEITIDGDTMKLNDLICFFYAATQNYSILKSLCAENNDKTSLENIDIKETNAQGITQPYKRCYDMEDYDDRPNEDDYDDLDSYLDAMDDWLDNNPGHEAIIYPDEIDIGWDDQDIWEDDIYDEIRDKHPDWDEELVEDYASHLFMIKNMEMQKLYYMNLNNDSYSFQYNALLNNYVTQAMSTTTYSSLSEVINAGSKFFGKYESKLRTLAKSGNIAGVVAGLAVSTADLLNGNFKGAIETLTSTVINLRIDGIIFSILPAPLEYQHPELFGNGEENKVI